MLRKLYYTLTPSLRLLARRLYYLPTDLLRRKDKAKRLIPPRGLVYTGGGDFEEVGSRYGSYFIQYAGLKPHHYVLDIGCGIGRMALPLTQYLNSMGRYDGFDVVKQGIRWCQKNISQSYPNFHFLHVALRNDLYTSKGDDAQSFKFPYSDDSFDLVICISVFTHMIRKEVENYLSEIHCVLHAEGYLFATFFILDDISRKKMQGRSFRFDYASDGCFLMDRHVRSANVAFDESELMRMIEQHGYAVTQRIHGNWSGREDASSEFQDILVLRARKGAKK